MQLQCGLAVTCTHTASEYSSQKALNTHTHTQGKTCLHVKAASATETPHTVNKLCLTHTKLNDVGYEKTQIHEHLQKDAHISADKRTQRAVGTL